MRLHKTEERPRLLCLHQTAPSDSISFFPQVNHSMPRNKGIGAKRKRKAVTSTPKEVTPDKEDEPEVAEEEEAEKPQFDD